MRKVFCVTIVLLMFSLSGLAQYPEQQGYLGYCGCNSIIGYAFNVKNISERASVDIFADGHPIGRVKSTGFRYDWFVARYGDGFNSFMMATPVWLQDNQPHTIQAFYSNSQEQLDLSPRTLQCDGNRTKAYSSLFEGSSDCQFLTGYALETTDQPNGRVTVEIIVDGVWVDTLLVNQLRSDVGNHGIVYPIPNQFKNGLPHVYDIRITTTGKPLTGSPKTITCS